MYMKKISSLLIAVATLAATVSCSLGSSSQKAGYDSDGLESGNSKELTMYIMDYDATSQKAVEKFNQIHKDVQIKAKSLTAISAGNLGSKLMYELNSGKGPDIILCEQNTLPNMSVFFNKGSFYDLNTLINKDKSFKKTDYFEKVFEYGVYKEKRFVIPLSFKINSLYTTKEILDKSGQGISSTGAGIDDFIKGSAKHIAVISANSPNAENGKYYVSDISFSSLLQTAPKPFFDLANKYTNFNSKDFGDLLEKYKSLSEATCPDIMAASSVESNNLLSSDKAVFASIQTMGPRYAAEPYGSFKAEVEPLVMPAPYADTTRHVLATPEKYIGINSKCGNVEAAYDFIKLMLSKDFQDTDLMEGIPVNRKAYTQEKERCLKGMSGYDTWRKGGCKSSGTLKALYSQLDELIDNIDRCWTTDDYLLTIVENEVDSYLKSNSTKENTLKVIQEGAEAYLKNGFMVESLNKEDETPSDPAKTISLYYWNNSQCYVTNSVREYKDKYPDITLKMKTFDSFDGFYNTTAVEIMSGGGPDIIIFEPSYYKSIDKVVSTGVFCEMDDYIKKLDILNIDDYNKSILSNGVYNGKRYYIPLYFYYSPIISTQKILKENNITIDENNWSWSNIAQYSKEFMKRNKEKGRYFLSSDINLSKMLRSCEVPFIDYKNKKSNFNSEPFKELLKLYKEIYPSIDPNADYFKNVIKRDAFISDNNIGQALFFRFRFDDVRNYSGDEMVLIPTPTLSGIRKEFARASDCIAVNARCKNKDAAFLFIKIAASYEMQRDYDRRGQANGWASPVNNKSYIDDMLSYQSSDLIPKPLVNKMINYHGIVEYCPIKDYSTLDMADELAEDYIKGEKTADQVAKELDKKVSVYLNE